MIEDSYDPDFPFPHLDDPNIGTVRYIGVDKVIVDRKTDNTHWSDLPKPVSKTPDFPSWYDQDNSARSPLEADLENIDD